jgi:hypothetical protein
VTDFLASSVNGTSSSSVAGRLNPEEECQTEKKHHSLLFECTHLILASLDNGTSSSSESLSGRLNPEEECQPEKKAPFTLV